MVADAIKRHRPPRGRRCAATSLAAATTLLLALVALTELLTPRSQPGASSAATTTIRISLRTRFSELGAATAVARAARRAAPRQRQRSYYQQWVERDFQTWAESGITPKMVTQAATARTFRGVPPIRFQIIDGVLWADHPPAAGDNAWAAEPGWISAKGRIPATLLQLADLLHSRPGEVPNVDAVWHQEDMPLFFRNGSNWADWWATGMPPKKPRKAPWLPPPPVLSYTGHSNMTDVPVPDYTWLAHERDHLTDASGAWLWGWEEQRAYLQRRWASVPLLQREPRLVFRGRVFAQARDALRRAFVTCPALLEKAGRRSEAALFNLEEPAFIPMNETCRHRFIANIESQAFSTSFKARLACGSVVIAPKLHFYEFWQRELQPGVHYVEVADEGQQEMCDQIVAAVTAMNARLDGSSGGRSWGSRASGSASDADSSSSSGSRWASSLNPDEIVHNAQEFLRRHVRLEDARSHLLGVLEKYASLQRFKPRPSKRAACITGKRILAEYASPHPEDAAMVAQQYPWLAEWDPGCPGRTGDEAGEQQ